MAVATAEWTELRDRGRYRQDTKYYVALTKSPETPAPLAPDTVQKPFSHSSPSQGMASGGRGCVLACQESLSLVLSGYQANLGC